MVDKLCLNCMKEKENNICENCGAGPIVKPKRPYYLKPGTILVDKYILGNVIGAGGFGNTYIAYDIKNKLRLAIKEYFPSQVAERAYGSIDVVPILNNDEEFKKGLERLKIEAETLKEVNDLEGIVNVKDFILLNNTGYIVMEYEEGKTLREYIRTKKNKRLEVDEVLELFLPIMDVLQKVHEKKIFHRDISPDNLYVNTEKNKMTLIDFGSAKYIFTDNQKTLTIFFKEGYTAPEQFCGEKNQGAWTDVYSLAATMYSALTAKKPPFSFDRFEMDWRGEKPSDLGINIEKNVEAAILKALSVTINERFGSVLDFKKAILDKDFKEISNNKYMDKMINTQLDREGYKTYKIDPTRIILHEKSENKGAKEIILKKWKFIKKFFSNKLE